MASAAPIRILELGPYLRVDPFTRPVRCVALRRLAHDAPEAAIFAESDLPLGMGVVLIGPHGSYLAA